MELQDIGSFASVGVGVGVAWKNARDQGLDLGDVFSSVFRGTGQAINPIRQATQDFRAYKKSAYSYKEQLRTINATTGAEFLSKVSSFEQHEEAIRMSLMEAISRPGFRSRLASIQAKDNLPVPTFSSVTERLAGIRSPAALKSYVDNIFKQVGGSIPEFQAAVISGIHRRRSIAAKQGKTYKEFLKNMQRDLTVGSLSGQDFTRPLNVIKSISGQQYSGELKNFLGQLHSRGFIKQDAEGYLKSMLKRGDVFSMTDAAGNQSSYARITAGGQEFNFPLADNVTRLSSGRTLPVYHPGKRSGSMVSLMGNFYSYDADTNALRVDKAGSPIRMSGDQALFRGGAGQDPLILQMIEEANKRGTSVQNLMAGFGDDYEVGDVFRYGQYFQDSPSGANVPLMRQSMSTVLGREQFMEDVGGSAEMNRIVAAQVRAGGGTPLAFASPGAAGKHGAFHVRYPGEASVMDLMTDAELFSGIRRPLQGLADPWEITNQSAVVTSKGVGFSRKVLKSGKAQREIQGTLYNPVQSAMYQTPIFRSMTQNGMAPYVTPTFYSRPGSRLAGGEGEFAVRKRKGGGRVGTDPIFKGIKKTHNLARPGASGMTETTKVSSQFFDRPDRRNILSEIEGAANAEDRRKIVQGAFAKPFKEGAWLGQSVDANLGLVDEVLNIGGTGDIFLEDIIPNEKGFKLQFQRRTQLRAGEKAYFSIKGVSREEDLDYLLSGSMKDKGLRSFMETAGEASEIARAGNYGHLRNQQITGLGYTIGNRLGLLNDRGMNKSLGQNAENLVGDLLIRNSGPTVYDNMRRLGDPLSSLVGGAMSADSGHKGIAAMAGQMGNAAYQRQFSMLLGTVQSAFNARNILDDNDLGLVFGLEKYDEKLVDGGKYTFGELGALLDNSKTRAALAAGLGNGGDNFLSRLSSGISSSRGVVGESVLWYRDQAGAYPESRPKVERRAIQSLLQAPDDSFVNLGGGVTEKQVLMSDLAYGIDLPDAEFQKGINTITNAYKNVPKKVGGRYVNATGAYTDVTQMKALMADAGGWINLKAITGSDDVAYLPSPSTLGRVGPAIATDASLDPKSSPYGQALDRLTGSVDRYATAASSGRDLSSYKANVGAAYEALRRQENVAFHRASSSIYSGSVRHSSYQMIRSGKLISGTSDDALAEAMTFGLSKKNINEMFNRAVSTFQGDEQLVDQLNAQRSAILSDGKRGAMAIQRSPTITERGRQMLGFRYDRRLDELPNILVSNRREVQLSGELKKLIGDKIDVSALMAAANSSDFDGDRSPFNVIAGEHNQRAFDWVNSNSNLAQKAYDVERHVIGHATIESMMKRQIKGMSDELVETTVDNFLDSQGKLMGQAEIGLLSYNTESIKLAAQASTASGLGTLPQLSRQNYQTLEKALYVLDQKGAIGFKHAQSGQSIAAMITSDLQGVLELNDLNMATDRFEGVLRKWIGDDLFDKGYSYTTGDGVTETIKLGKQFKQEMMFGLSVLQQQPVRDAYTLARKQAGDMAQITAKKFQQGIDGGAQMGGLLELSQSLSADFMQSKMGTESVSEMLIGKINAGIKAAASNRRSMKLAPLAGPIGLGLAASAGIYGLFDKGYSSTPLEAPMRPDGTPGNATSIGLRMAIRDGSLLRQNVSGGIPGGIPLGNPNPGYHQAGQQPQGPPPGPGQAPPPTPNMIPRGTVVDGSTGRISMNGVVPSNVDVAEVTGMLKATMPFAQVGINVNHNYSIPRDLDHQM